MGSLVTGSRLFFFSNVVTAINFPLDNALFSSVLHTLICCILIFVRD